MAKIQPGFLSHQVVNFTWIPVSCKRFLPGRTENPAKLRPLEKDLCTPDLNHVWRNPDFEGRGVAVKVKVGGWLGWEAELEPQHGQNTRKVPRARATQMPTWGPAMDRQPTQGQTPRTHATPQDDQSSQDGDELLPGNQNKPPHYS